MPFSPYARLTADTTGAGAARRIANVAHLYRYCSTMPNTAEENRMTITDIEIRSLTGHPGTRENPVGDIAWAETRIRETIGDDHLADLYARTPDTWTEDDEQRLYSALWILEWLGDYDVDHEWHAELRGEWSLIHRTTGGAAAYPQLTPKEIDKYTRQRSTWAFIRTELGYRTADAAKQIGVTQPTLSRWESGSRDPDGHHANMYRQWLTRRRAEILALNRYHTLRLATIRDRWPAFPRGAEQHAVWRELWRTGGWFDQYRRTATLPNTRP